MKSYTAYTITTEHAGLTVEAYLKQVLKVSGRKIQRLTRQKGILLNRRSVFLQKKLKLHDVLSVVAETDHQYGVVPEAGSVDILYEDIHLVIVNKPPYQLVHPAGKTTCGTLANFLAYHWQQQGVLATIRPLHRLDRDTSGCLIIAKTAQCQTLLEKELHANSLHRSYQAVVTGIPTPPSGTITASIGQHPTSSNRRTVTSSGAPAVTHYKVLESASNVSLLEVRLETGRTHQIRLHLSHIGHSVIGDRMYGVPSSQIPRQALHASSINFIHPFTQEHLTIHAPLPQDMNLLLQHFHLTPVPVPPAT